MRAPSCDVFQTQLYASTVKQKQCFPGSQYSNILLQKIRSVDVTGRSQMSNEEEEVSQIKTCCFLIYEFVAL